MIITDEELLALLDAEEHEAAGFCPIVLYALDGVSHALASATTLPSYVTLHRTQPDACWQWEGLFAAGAIALYDPAAHQQADYFPQMQSHQGIYAIGEDWLGGLAASYRDWCCWLAANKIVLLEDHPFQGMQLQQTIAALGLSCQWVQDEAACLAALAAGDTRLLVCDLSLVEQDAISLLMSQPRLQQEGLPIVLLSAHEQTLIDGARRLLHDAGFNILAALAKPLDCDALLRLLRRLYLGPLRQQRLSGQRRTIRSWQGEVQGQLGLLSSPATPHPVWLAVTGLPSRWDALKEWLAEQSRAPSELTLLIHRRDHLLGNADRFALVLQASLAGSKLALLLDNSQHLPFDLLERLPLQALLLGQGILPEMESLTGDALLGRFMARVKELGIAVYLDDPYNLLDVDLWRERGMTGRW
ncbi:MULTISPECIES: response regulator [unclassified Aeromonas]|uniref:response regulator n=1 Tax=unclassified Aeromonas TaxID=257493 RepID=UPI0022E0350D|nr:MULTISPECIES: response regulator [unclassified Aeromonas]